MPVHRPSLRRLALFLAMLLLGASASAAPLFTSYKSLIKDPNETDPITPGRDILELFYGDSEGYRYFKMKLEQAPAAGAAGYADSYGIFIDIDHNPATGGKGTDFLVVPDALNGIDVILDSHFDPEKGWIDFNEHIWNTSMGKFLTGHLGSPSHAENGTEIEWRALLSELPVATGWHVWGATHDIFDTVTTYDITGMATIPIEEPPLALGLACGLLGMLGAPLMRARARRGAAA